MPDARGDPNRRLTNAERREEARLKREELQRRMAKKKRGRMLGGLALIVAAALLVALVVFEPFAGDNPGADPADLLARAPAATDAAGCTDVETIGPYGDISDPGDPGYLDEIHIGSEQAPAPPKLSTYPSVPPTSGPHAQSPQPAGVYPQPPEVYGTLHSLEHGATIVWYRPTATGPRLDELTSFYGQRVSDAAVGQDRVLVAPYEYPAEGEAGSLPAGVEMALVSWHHMQTCTAVSLPAAFAFTSAYSAPPSADQDYAGDAPEAGGAL